MIGVHEVEVGTHGINVGDDCQRHVVEPDVFTQRLSGIVRLHQQMPGAIVEIVRGAGRRHVRRRADRQPLQAVIGVVGGHRRADGEFGKSVPVVVAVIVSRAAAGVVKSTILT